MKKTWKACLYDFVNRLILIFAVLGLCSLGILIVFFFCGIIFSIWLNETWMNVLLDSFLINGELIILLYSVFAPIISCEKEKFLRNKLIYILFSDSWTNFSRFLVLAMIVVDIFSEEFKNMLEAEIMLGIIVPGFIAIIAFSWKLSEYCQKKISRDEISNY